MECASALQLPIEDGAIDLVFCHQLLHHMTCQAEALAEMLRVLRPEGLLLLCESCRCFIESSLVRVLFRHPMAAQKPAGAYIDLIYGAGFAVDPGCIETATPWWSRRDFGLGAALGRVPRPNEEPTEVLVIGRKRRS